MDGPPTAGLGGLPSFATSPRSTSHGTGGPPIGGFASPQTLHSTSPTHQTFSPTSPSMVLGGFPAPATRVAASPAARVASPSYGSSGPAAMGGVVSSHRAGPMTMGASAHPVAQNFVNGARAQLESHRNVDARFPHLHEMLTMGAQSGNDAHVPSYFRYEVVH